MTETLTVALEGSADSGTITITHGGVEGTQLHAAVVDSSAVVTALVLLPADWHEQDPVSRYWPGDGLDVVVLDEVDLEHVTTGARRVGGRWVAPEPLITEAAPAAPEPALHSLVALVDALRALTPVQAAELQQLLTVPAATT